MIDIGAGLHVRRRLLMVLLVCLALPLVGGCSFDPECIAAPFLPQCFEDDDEEEKTDDTATQTRVRGNARADDIDTTMVALRHTLDMSDDENFTHLIQLFLATHPDYRELHAQVRAQGGDPQAHWLSGRNGEIFNVKELQRASQ